MSEMIERVAKAICCPDGCVCLKMDDAEACSSYESEEAARAAIEAMRTGVIAVLYRENTSTETELRLQFEWPVDQPWPASVRACKGESANYECKLYRPAADTDKSIF